MKFYYTSDLHLDDTWLSAGVGKVLGYEEYVSSVIDKINSKVPKESILYVLGDFGDPIHAAKIRASVVLLLGNHDIYEENLYSKFLKVFRGNMVINEEDDWFGIIYLAHKHHYKVPMDAVYLCGHCHNNILVGNAVNVNHKFYNSEPVSSFEIRYLVEESLIKRKERYESQKDETLLKIM